MGALRLKGIIWDPEEPLAEIEISGCGTRLIHIGDLIKGCKVIPKDEAGDAQGGKKVLEIQKEMIILQEGTRTMQVILTDYPDPKLSFPTIPKQPPIDTECIEQITQISNDLTSLLNRLRKATDDFRYQRITQKRYIKETRDIYQKSNGLFILSMDIVGENEVANRIFGDFSSKVALYSEAFLAANDLAKNPTTEKATYVAFKLGQAQKKNAEILAPLPK